MAEPLLATHDLTVGYHNSSEAAVAGLTIHLHTGFILGIAGPTGSGKTALLDVLAGVSPRRTPARMVGGEFEIFGKDPQTLFGASRRRVLANIGYLRQGAAMDLNPHLTVAENIGGPILERDKRWDRRDLAQRIFYTLYELGLPESMAAKYPHELSSGQRQRVALARSVILEPRLLILDDPTRGVDPIARRKVIEFLRKRKMQPDFTAIIVTMNRTILTEIADSLVILEDGQVSDFGDRDQVLSEPNSPFIEELAEIFPLK